MAQALDNVSSVCCDRLSYDPSESVKEGSKTFDEGNNLSDDLLCDHEEFPFCDCLAKYAGRFSSSDKTDYLSSRDNESFLKDFRMRNGSKRSTSCRSLDSCSSPSRTSLLEVLEEAEETESSELGAVAIVKPEDDRLRSSLSSVGLLGTPSAMDSGCRRASIVTSDTRSDSLKAEGEPVKIAVFGKEGVGKSALIVRLVTGRFIGEYDPSMEAIYNYQIPLPGHQLPLQVMDTAGKVESQEKGRESQVCWGEGFLLVFSLTNHDSLSALHHMRRTLVDLTPGSPRPLALVGNKADLCRAREVTATEVIDLADLWGCEYFETSAAEPWDVVVRPFLAMYHAVLEARAPLN